jgi:regulator of RNase E activity RraA
MSDALFEILRKVTTATITTMLLRKGIRRCWMNGPKSIGSAGGRIVGRAFTLRFIPVREDLATIESWGNPVSTRAAVEEMPEGSVVVADAMGAAGAGIFGDILCARMKKRNVAALVTDGAVRDRAGVLTSTLAIWCAGVAAPASVNQLTFVGWQEPKAMVDYVAGEGAEHELYESWVFSEVENGVKLPGLYPPNDEAKARYAVWRKSRS